MSTPSAAPKPEPHIEPVAEPEVLPPPAAPVIGKRPFTSVPEPKNKQFTGRATEKEYERINKALAAHGGMDIVRFALKMMNHIENDIFQTFKTK